MGIDRVRDELFKKRFEDEDVIKGMNNTVAFMLQQAFGKVQNGEIEIKDATDISRLWNIMQQTTNYNEVMENADNKTSGQLPALKTREAKVLGVGQTVNEDGEVVTEDLDQEAFTDSDVEEIFANLSVAMNQDNIDTQGDSEVDG